MKIPLSTIKPFGVLGFPTINMAAARRASIRDIADEMANLADIQPMNIMSLDFMKIRYELGDESLDDSPDSN